MASHGRYTIKGKLADGGMAEIFLAAQHGAEGFEKPVVLKRILTQYSADQQFRNMLLDEAHISMSLQHSNIAQVLDLGVAGGRYFLALELVDGWDLERILQRAHAAGMVWPAALALHVAACVCRALAYAHAKSRDDKPLGIVHRDISPNNVLISDQGEVKLTDFGIAKAQRKREKTAAGVIKGKVAYMSPEQGIGGVIDKRSDIFSVGSMLYRMLTDKLPFEADNDMDSLLKVQRAEFDPPEKVKPTISPSVSSIIMRAMRLAPSERYQAADEMLSDVERALRTEFHSAGQTELKLWLEQLARRDDVPSIGKRRVDTAGIVKGNLGTDLSAGTSFELDDLDPSSSQTELAITTGDLILQRSDPGRAPKVPGAKTAAVRLRQGAPKRRVGFWFGVIATLAVVVGIRYLLRWAEQKGIPGTLGLGNGDAIERPPTVGQPAPAPTPTPPTPATAPTPTPVPAPTPPPAAPRDAVAVVEETKPVVAAGPGVDAQAAPDAAPTKATAVAEKGDTKDKKGDTKDKDDEPDEEALLRDAVPDAESAVIGEEEAEVAAPPKAAAGKAAAKARPPIAKPGPGKVDTAVLHITTAPGGAIVRTKARVLGRTPINLHFKSGNIYEIIFIKSGYQTATRKVAVQGTKDRKVAVTLLKKRPPAKKSFFKPHR